jgi:hypothetical protein
MGSLIDLTGEVFGRLTVISKDDKQKGKEIKWICKCKCNKLTSVRGADLRGGKTKSCGCLIKTNEFMFYDTHVECHLKNGLNFTIDKDDYDLIKNYSWQTNSENYVQTTINNKSVKLHRFLMNPKENEYVDHINHNTLDNRKENLRVCTNEENCRNKRTYKNNTSGVKGVTWMKKNQVWIARITYNKKRIHLGCFSTLEEAKKSRQEAEIKYFGEFRYLGGK